MKRIGTKVLGTLMVVALPLILVLLTACGGESKATPIGIAGSSTVFPISEAIAEEFSKANPGVRVNVASTGTGAGFRAICAGETQVSNASRPVKQSEIDTCAENDIDLIEIPVAFDALSVVVNLENDWARCLSVEELVTIFGPDAQGVVDNWSQVDRPSLTFGCGFMDRRLRRARSITSPRQS